MMKKFISLTIIMAMFVSLLVFPAGVSAEVGEGLIEPKLEVTITPVTAEELDAYIQAVPAKKVASNFTKLYKTNKLTKKVTYDANGMATFLGLAEGTYAYLVDATVSDLGDLYAKYQIYDSDLFMYDSRSIASFALYFTAGNDTELFDYTTAKGQKSISTDINLGQYESIYAAKGTSYGIFFYPDATTLRYPLPTDFIDKKSMVDVSTEDFTEFNIKFVIFTKKADFDLKMGFDVIIGDFNEEGNPMHDTMQTYSLKDPDAYEIEQISYFDNFTINGEKTLFYQGGNGAPQYTVVFNDSTEAAEAKGLDDVKLKEVTVKSGDTVVPPENPADYEVDDVLYKFTGWDKSYDAPTENITVTAVYNAVPKRTVKFVEDDGETQIGDTITVNTDEIITADELPEATKEADEDYFYEFKGWKTVIGDAESTDIVTFPYKIVADTTFKAVFEAKDKVTVVFENEDGTEYHSEAIASGSNVYAPENPSKVDPEGQVEYRFAGWSLKDDESQTILSFPIAPIMDVTFVPVFTEYELYTVIFENADGTVASEQSIADGSKVAKLDPVAKEPTETESYEFLYWSVNGADATSLFPYTVTADTTFKPVYKVVPRHLVTFYDGDGNVFETQRVTDGTKATAPANVPTKTNTDKVRYTFKNWQSVINNNVTGDIEIYPVFTPEYINTVNYKKADANLDGKVDARDGILYAKHIAETAIFDEALIPYMDLNEDDVVTMADLQILVQYLITEDMSLIN